MADEPEDTHEKASLKLEHISILRNKISYLENLILEKVKNYNETYGSIDSGNSIYDISFEAIRHIGDLEKELQEAIDNEKFFTKLYEPPLNIDNLAG